MQDSLIRMRTADNGIGFDTNHIKKGIGLSNMRKRVNAFCGNIFLSSSPGNGCEVIVEIPTGITS